MYRKVLKRRLIDFLGQNGITIQFIRNMKSCGRPGVRSVEQLVDFMHKSGAPQRQAIFWAFCWTDSAEYHDNNNYWVTMAFRWRKFLQEKLNVKKSI